MAFTFSNVISPELSKSPLNDIISNLFGGYEQGVKASYLQPGLAEELKKAKLVNQYYGPNIESEIGLRGAQAGHLGALTQGENIKNKYLPRTLESDLKAAQFKADNPLLSSTGTAGQLGALLYLQHHPELMQLQNQTSLPTEGQGALATKSDINNMNSYVQSLMENPNHFSNQTQQPNSTAQINPQQMMLQSIINSLQPKNKQYAPSNIGKLQQEYADVKAGYYPHTNRTIPFESEEVKEEVAAPYLEKLGGLKTGEHYVYDPETHEKVGMQRPYTPKERDTETGRAFFNEVFPTINNGFKDFIGKGSIENFQKYAREYGQNEVATRKIDDLLLAQKLISAGVVNEAATLGAGKTNMTYRNLAKSFPNSDLPKLIEAYGKGLLLPGDAFVKAGIRFNKMINQAQEKAIGSVPALKTQYFHPEKHMVSEEKTSHSEKPTHYTESDIEATATKYGITKEEVKKRLKKAKKNG